ncbi:hypothetical protein FWH13_00230 [Candidatus Saccharibacteria bacterium]|nr:hypothetical protein [Candidatus Saccharibacteria bacterium]
MRKKFLVVLVAIFALLPILNIATLTQTVDATLDSNATYGISCFGRDLGNNQWDLTISIVSPQSGTADQRRTIFNASASNVPGADRAAACANRGIPSAIYEQHGTVVQTASTAQSLINTVRANGNWTITVDESGSSPEVTYPQYFASCGTSVYQTSTWFQNASHNVSVTIRRRTDANTITDVFRATITNIPGSAPSVDVACANHGIPGVGSSFAATPITEEQAQAIVNMVNANSAWSVEDNMMGGDSADPNRFFARCDFRPDVGGAEREVLYVQLWQGNVSTANYHFILGSGHGGAIQPGQRDCQNWLGLQNDDTRHEITEARHNAILALLTDARDSDISYGQSLNIDDSEVTCELGRFGWAICALVETANGLLGSIYTFVIEAMLRIPAEFMQVGGGTYQAWEIFRNIANIVFIILFLIVIFSQISGIGIDNYGIKKIMPKLIISAILINLSFFIAQAAVDISNIIGHQINSLLANIEINGISGGLVAPTPDPDGGGIDFMSIIAPLLGIGLAAGAFLTIAGGAGGVAAVFIMLILSGLVAVAIIFAVLVFRQVAVVLLVVLSPLAFAAMLLPNTEKLSNAWLKAFKAMLVVYPVAGALMGGGLLAGRIIAQAGGPDNTLFGLIAAAATILPFFLVVTVTKAALLGLGKLGGNLTGRINGLGKSAESRAKKPLADYQAEKKAQYDAKIKAGAGIFGGKDPRKFLADQSDRAKMNRQQKTADYQAAASGAYKGSNKKLSKINKRSQMRLGSYVGNGMSYAAMASEVAAGSMTQAEMDTEIGNRVKAGTYQGNGTDVSTLIADAASTNAAVAARANKELDRRAAAGIYQGNGMSYDDVLNLTGAASSMTRAESDKELARRRKSENKQERMDSRGYLGRKRSAGVAAENKNERELMEGVAADMEMRYGNNTAGLSAEFQSALMSGDKVKTKALTNMLASRGAEGIQALSDNLSTADAARGGLTGDDRKKYDDARGAFIKAASSDANNREISKENATLASWSRGVNSTGTDAGSTLFMGKGYDQVSNNTTADGQAAQQFLMDNVVTKTGDRWKQSGESLAQMLENPAPAGAVPIRRRFHAKKQLGAAIDMASDAKHSRNGAQVDHSRKHVVAKAMAKHAQEILATGGTLTATEQATMDSIRSALRSAGVTGISARQTAANAHELIGLSKANYGTAFDGAYSSM